MELEKIKELLEKDYSVSKISKELKIGRLKITNFLRENNLHTKLNNYEYKNCAICDNELQGNQRKFCSNNCKSKAFYKNSNSSKKQHKKGVQRKLFLIEKMGGKCQECGYNKNLAAFDFHHRDRNEKKFSLDMKTLSNKKLEEILLEASKCDIICSNCHRELHHPEMDVFNFKKNNDFNNEFSKTRKEIREEKINYCSCDKKIDKKAKKCRKCYSLSKRRAERPPLEQLLKEVNEQSYVFVGKKYGVNGNAIKKWIKNYGAIPPSKQNQFNTNDIIKRYSELNSFRGVAIEFGIDGSTVKKIVSKIK